MTHVFHQIPILQCVLALSMVTVSAACLLLTTSGGRELLRRLNGYSKDHPWRFLAGFAVFGGLVLWGGDKPPGPVVTQRGITLTRCVQTPAKVTFEWEADDDRIAPGSAFRIQEYDRDEGAWVDIGSTTNTVWEMDRFTVHKNNRWRIAADVGEEEEE